MLKHNLITRALTSGLVIAAAGFPATAQAMYLDEPSAPSTGPAQPRPTAHTLLAPGPHATTGARLVDGSQSGFQWGDAGIGAAGAAVLIGAAAAGAGVTRRRRVQRPVTG